MNALRILGLALVAWLFGASAVAAEPLHELVTALERFRGLGDPAVSAYAVELRIPSEEDEVAPLTETWEAPARMALRARHTSTPVAIVRGLALFLEPLYVTRTSIFSLDFEEALGPFQKELGLTAENRDSGRWITLDVPEVLPADFPEELADLRRLVCRVDDRGRLVELSLTIRSGAVEERMKLFAVWGQDQPQPRRVEWALPGGEVVEIETTFRPDAGRVVPASRLVKFPSRYDPGEREEIFVEYGEYDFAPAIAPDFWTERGTFRFDENGLVDDSN